MDKATLQRIAFEHGYEKKNNNIVNKRILSDYFSIIDTPTKAYWIGFLLADGSVDHSHASGRIRLQLQKDDIEILEKFKEDLHLDCKIIADNRPEKECCSVEFVDEQIFNDLARFGIVPKKLMSLNIYL